MEVGGHGDVIAPPQCTVEPEGPGAVDNGNMSLREVRHCQPEVRITMNSFDAQLTMITDFSADAETTALPQFGSWTCVSEACRPLENQICRQVSLALAQSSTKTYECAFPQDLSNFGS